MILPPIPPEPGSSHSVPDIERDYFISNATRMRYPAFRAQGMQIGSGIIEASCKMVVSTRAKRTAVPDGTYDAFCEQHSHLLT